ncbi:alpha/beta-hydrolase [Aaosphaeria arxii CBS 175.79]|uniref:Alpha/beta-hydrolase n=1 Tax=Aaosphaeria arxii CBS 175.79 TaxID=1450172 RepID=A0A6A5XJ00_9PLEO|nr:alpha/beta-hydrolase [Aaosphaeria arxii CBS 175.79]KAF2012933.1 alpha/beta-hydrolase [Aaosphaeria arxii CBS 175.79]
MSLRTTAATRFDSFDVHRTSYKTIGSHEIEATVLIPKAVKPGKHPLFVKWHGGGLTAGEGAYPDWFPAYLVSLLLRNDAIAVLPNYRLTPEHSGDEILQDIADFWTWLRASLPAFVASKSPSTEIDLSKILVSGDSAGGWCAIQSILTLPQSTFNACLLQYPVTNLIPTSPDDTPCGETIPPKEVLDEFIANIVPGTVVSSAIPPARSDLAPMLRAHRRWTEFFGDAKHLMPDTRIEDATFLAPTYIIHGKDDTNVGVELTHAFVEKAEKLIPGARFKVATPPGDHGFDTEIYEEDEPWLKDILEGVEADWLA